MGHSLLTPASGLHTRARHGARASLIATVVLLLLLLVVETAQAAVSGKLLYSKRIGGSGTTEAGGLAIAAGPSGMTALAGGQETNDEMYPMVAKYTSAGVRKWLKAYCDAGTGYMVDVAFDRAGNVYAAATVDTGASEDIVVVKYSAAGAFRWATTPYDGGSSGRDEARELAVDRYGNVVVLGESNVTGLTGVVVLKYDKNGHMAWAGPVRWDPDPDDPNAGPDWVDDLALDGLGDIYVAGATEYMGLENAIILKVLGTDGAKQKGWVYDPRNGDSSSFDEVVVRGSTVVTSGSIWNHDVDGSENALVVKFSLGLNERYWKEWGLGNASEEWFGQAVIDDKGNVLVTGDQWVAAADGYGKAVTMKLNGKLSKVLWKRTYMPTSKDAEGWYIVRDGAGNVYVGGVKNANIGQASYLTMKYSPAGVRKWVRTWSGGGPGENPAGLVLGSKDGVYVGGHAWSKAGVHQAVLLKYQR